MISIANRDEGLPGPEPGWLREWIDADALADRAASMRSTRRQNDDAAHVRQTCTALAEMARRNSGQRVTRTMLREAGLTADAAREAASCQQRRIRRGRMAPGDVGESAPRTSLEPVNEHELVRARSSLGLSGAAGNVERHAIASILRAVAEALATDGPDELPTLVVDRRGTLVLTPQRRIRPEWVGDDTNVVLLDATPPERWMIEAVLPEGRQVTAREEVHARWPGNVHAVLRPGMPITKRKLLGPQAPQGDESEEAADALCEARRNPARIRSHVAMRAVAASLMGPAPMMLAAQKDIIQALAGTAPNIKTTWFNRSRGSNEFETAQFALSIGRTLPPPQEVEIASGFVGEAVDLTDGWYPRGLVKIVLRDGRAAAIRQERHPDLAAEALRRTICEDEVRNGVVGRVRPVRREDEVRIEIWDDRRHDVPISALAEAGHNDAAGEWWAQARSAVLLHSPKACALVGGISEKAAGKRLAAARRAWGTFKGEVRPLTSWDGGTPSKPFTPGLVTAEFTLMKAATGEQVNRKRVSASILPGDDGRALDFKEVCERLRALLEPRGLRADAVVVKPTKDPSAWRP